MILQSIESTIANLYCQLSYLLLNSVEIRFDEISVRIRPLL